MNDKIKTILYLITFLMIVAVIAIFYIGLVDESFMDDNVSVFAGLAVAAVILASLLSSSSNNK